MMRAVQKNGKVAIEIPVNGSLRETLEHATMPDDALQLELSIVDALLLGEELTAAGMKAMRVTYRKPTRKSRKK